MRWWDEPDGCSYKLLMFLASFMLWYGLPLILWKLFEPMVAVALGGFWFGAWFFGILGYTIGKERSREDD